MHTTLIDMTTHSTCDTWSSVAGLHRPHKQRRKIISVASRLLPKKSFAHLTQDSEVLKILGGRPSKFGTITVRVPIASRIVNDEVSSQVKGEFRHDIVLLGPVERWLSREIRWREVSVEHA